MGLEYGKTVDASPANWEKEVLESELMVVALFWTPTCPHCKALMPVFNNLSVEYQGKIKFVKLNAEQHQVVAEGYSIMGVPTLKFFCQGRPISELVGRISKEELKEFFDRLLTIHKKCIATSSPIYYV